MVRELLVSLLSSCADGSTLSLLQVGTHADSLIASAVTRNVTGFDLELAYEAVKKDSDLPPVNDTSTLFVLSSTLSRIDCPSLIPLISSSYADREEWTDQEVRAGLTLYKEKGFVAVDEVS